MASALSNRQNCTCACKTLQTQRGWTHGAGCVRQWFHTTEPLGERRYEIRNTHTHTQSVILSLKLKVSTPSQPIKLLYMVFLSHWLAESIFTPLPVQVTYSMCWEPDPPPPPPRQRSPIFKLDSNLLLYVTKSGALTT